MKITVDGTIARLEVLPDSVVVGIETDSWPLQQVHVGREHAASLCAYVGKPCMVSIEVGEPGGLEFDDPRPLDFGSGGAMHVNSSRQSPVVSVSQGGVHVSDLSGESAADRILAGAARGDSNSESSYESQLKSFAPPSPPAVNPLDEGWRVLTAALEAKGFTRMPYDGSRVVKFTRSNGYSDPSQHDWVTVNDEYAARFAHAHNAVIESLLSRIGVQ